MKSIERIDFTINDDYYEEIRDYSLLYNSELYTEEEANKVIDKIAHSDDYEYLLSNASPDIEEEMFFLPTDKADILKDWVDYKIEEVINI